MQVQPAPASFSTGSRKYALRKGSNGSSSGIGTAPTLLSIDRLSVESHELLDHGRQLVLAGVLVRRSGHPVPQVEVTHEILQARANCGFVVGITEISRLSLSDDLMAAADVRRDDRQAEM